ncbi:hypothetical protein D3C74_112570 [compost metagenome]
MDQEHQLREINTRLTHIEQILEKRNRTTKTLLIILIVLVGIPIVFSLLFAIVGILQYVAR